MRAALLTTALVIGFGCNSPRHDVAMSEIIGQYVGVGRTSTEGLDLRRDGTYIHSIEVGGRKTTDSGEWSVIRDNGKTLVRMSRFDTSGWPEYMTSGETLNVTLMVQAVGDKVEVPVDKEYAYRKVK
jgi:hypothetical protein